MEATIFHHICIILTILWILSAFNYTNPLFYFASFAYLYLVHERYVERLRRNLRFDERKNSFQRRVLSDSETVRWLNYSLEKIWTVCMEEIVSQKVLLPIIPWFLEKYKPWTVKEVLVQQLYMGRSPPIFTEMRVVPQSTGDDHLVMELGMSFRSADDMSAVLDAKLTKRMGFGMWTKLHLTGLHIEGKVLVGVKFLRRWPFVGRLRVCFVEPPYFQMNAKPIFNHGIDVTELPGIAGWLDKLLAVAFEQTLVEPNMLVVDMEKFVSPQQEPWFSVDEKEPIAYAIVEVIDAADLKAADLNGLSDPYVKGQLGPYRFRTKTQKKTLFPKWHEEFKVPICSWESQNDLAIEVGDKDRFLDDLLGNCSISITDLRDGQRHEMWLSLKNVKTGRVHLAVTVVEGNKKVPDKKFDGETLRADKDESTIAVDAQKGSVSSETSRNSEKVVDKFEPINIEGQQETGIWVHQPGSEVAQIWEPRKGKTRLLDSQIVGEGSFRSSVPGNNNDSSSSDGSQDGNKGNKPNKMVRGLKKIGSLFHRSSSKLDSPDGIGNQVPSPHANIRALNEKDSCVKLIVDDSDIAKLSPLDVPISKPKDDTERENHQSPGGKAKEKTKSFLKYAGNSAHMIKHTFSRKGSNKSQGDSNLVETDQNLGEEGSVSPDEGLVPSPVFTTGVDSFQVPSKPMSVSPRPKPSDHMDMIEENPIVGVSHQGNQKINNDSISTTGVDDIQVASNPISVSGSDSARPDPNDHLKMIEEHPVMEVSHRDNQNYDNDSTTAVDSKPISVIDQPQPEPNDHIDMIEEDPIVADSHQGNQKINNYSATGVDSDQVTSKPISVANNDRAQPKPNDQMDMIEEDPLVVVSHQSNQNLNNDSITNNNTSLKEIVNEGAKNYAGPSTNSNENLEGA